MSSWRPHWERVNPTVEVTYLNAGAEPPWVRVTHDGVDDTSRPETWTAEDWQRRLEWGERVRFYRTDGLVPGSPRRA